jgi:hypothetical protein
MPVASITDAVDEMFDAVNTAWANRGPVHWPDVSNFDIPQSGSWCRVTLRHQDGGQSSLACGSGARRFTRVGTMWIQVFTEMGGGNTTSYEISEVLARAFEGRGSPLGIIYRNIRINEIGPDGAFSNTNVLVEFEYDQIH